MILAADDRTSQATILLIENNEGDICLADEALKNGGIPVRLHVVRNGVDALAFLNRTGAYKAAPRPALILLDLNMPRLDGREVLARIKTNDALKAIPVIVLSTSSSREDVLRSYELHANCYLTKPTELSEYLELVHAMKQFWLQMADLPPAF